MRFPGFEVFLLAQNRTNRADCTIQHSAVDDVHVAIQSTRPIGRDEVGTLDAWADSRYRTIWAEWDGVHKSLGSVLT